MADSFQIREDRIFGQHIREYPGATAHSDDDALQIEIKQYTPIDNLTPQPGDVTIIATHANAHCKELYEPLWEELLARSHSANFRIRNIWIADLAQQGASYIVNESQLGNDPHWFDHSRDLLHMVNHFREQMPRPIVGVGHSVGGPQMVFFSHLHPRLVHSLVLIEPSLDKSSPKQAKRVLGIAKYAVLRKDVWPSRSAAAASLSRNPFYRGWDPRVLSKLLLYGLRQTPTLLHPTADVNAVTVHTPKHQEVFIATRPNFNAVPANRSLSAEERITHPNLDPAAVDTSPFYRSEPREAFFLLRTLRPSVLFVYGDNSIFAKPEERQATMKTTGVGPGGSGGAPLGRVKEAVLPGGHFVVMERVDQVATSIADYLGDELGRWKGNERKFKDQWDRKEGRKKQMVDERWIPGN
ncbi:MAG: hypothetical protein LQ347_006255 [Umbilicaria vellea]|nr:MAG: hypothetical protein LQ347_006255 [Umbilicaria vellea]